MRSVSTGENASCETRFIPLTRGKVALVDEQDFARVSAFKWTYHNMGYAYRNVRGKSVLMHRFINGTPENMDTDHEDGDGLNNRRYNLRTSTHAQNMRNMRLRRDSTSGLKGASFDKRRGKWRSCIKVNYKEKHLGYFQTAQEAHAAYCAAAITQHGEFSRIA